MAYVTVARVGDVPSGQTYLTQIGTCQILLVHEAGQFYALQGVCSHQGLSLAGAQVWQGVVDCPWHHFQFDIRTGENLYPKRVYPLQALPQLRSQVAPLQTYPVRILGQEIQVGVAAQCFSDAGTTDT